MPSLLPLTFAMGGAPVPGIHVIVHSPGCVWLYVTPWAAACQASLPLTISQNLLKFMSVALILPSNHLILCCYLLLSILPSIRVFSSELALCIKWPEYWSFSFSISLSIEYSELISFKIDWFDFLLSKGCSRVFSSTTIWKHQFFGAQPSSWSNCHIHIWLLEKP